MGIDLIYKMPTLLQINVTANWGSTGKIAEQIGQCAIKNGWTSYIAYRWNHNSSMSKLIRVSGKYGKYFHYLGNFLLDKEGLFSSRDTKQLITRIKEIKPDVIHLHNIHDHWLNYKLLFEYLNQTDIKIVWTFHDCWAFTGHCFHFVTKNCERWKTQCHDCPLQHEYPKTLVDRSTKNFELKKKLFGGSKNLSVVVCSEWLGNFVKDSFLKDKPLTIIHNGVNLKVFRPTLPKKSIEDGKFRILAVSNVWNKEKGIDDIYKLREFLSDDYQITIVGLSEKQVKTLPSGIIGIQRTQNVQELVNLYSESDVLVNPTYADTFPTVNLEALACGTPIITYRTGGSPEAIDEKTGVIVDQGDIKSIAEALSNIRTFTFSQDECRNRAVKYFMNDKCFEKYIALYSKLIE